jgi:protein SCO1
MSHSTRLAAVRPVLAALAASALLAVPLAAASPPARSPLSPAREIGFDQKPGDMLPLDLPFQDETGATVRLGDYFGRKPVILSLVYYRCPMLCGLSLEGIASSLKTIAFDAGREFEVVTVSFDPRETPAAARGRKERSIDLYGRPAAAAGWHFLTGDEASIRRLTSAVGFRYAWDADLKQYAHPTGIVVLTPQGRIARYFFGVEYAARDLRLGLVEAAAGRLGSVADRLLLLCYQYDPRSGRYSAEALGAVRAAGALTVLGLGAFIVTMVRREKRAALETRPVRDTRAGS